MMPAGTMLILALRHTGSLCAHCVKVKLPSAASGIPPEVVQKPAALHATQDMGAQEEKENLESRQGKCGNADRSGQTSTYYALSRYKIALKVPALSKLSTVPPIASLSAPGQ
jgi:hypothetical protein